MRAFFMLLVVLLLVGCGQTEVKNNIADGNVTDEEAKIMQEAWCDYNKGKDFAKEQCENIWEESE